jgi:hypothetical protein
MIAQQTYFIPFSSVSFFKCFGCLHILLVKRFRRLHILGTPKQQRNALMKTRWLDISDLFGSVARPTTRLLSNHT